MKYNITKDDLRFNGCRVILIKDIKHPYVYPSGCVDMSFLNSADTPDNLVELTLFYLNNPDQYKFPPIHPDLL